MAPLVEYSDSEAEENTQPPKTTPPQTAPRIKRRKHAGANQEQTPAADMPPLPSSFHDLYATPSRVSTVDDPALYGGRKRVTPHVEGHWPTHVYLEWHPTVSQSKVLAPLLSKLDTLDSPAPTSGSAGAAAKLCSLLSSDLGADLPLHISLSRPISLETEQRQSFLDMLQTRIGKSGIRPFQVEFTCLDWVANYEQTRWFLVLRVARPPDDALNRLLHLTNQSVRTFGQRTLYVDSLMAFAGRPLPLPLPPSVPLRGTAPHAMRGRGGARARGKFTQSRKGPARVGSSAPATGAGAGAGAYPCPDVSDKYHVSIGWTLEKPDAERMERLRSLNNSEVDPRDGSSGGGVRGMRVQFDSVKIKIGNTVTDVPLPTKAEEGRGLIGT